MHEFALMESIFDIVQKQADLFEFQHIDRIGLEVGELSGAMPDALQFAFDVLKQNTPRMNDSTELEITFVKAKAKCVQCKQEYEPETYIAVCPSCHLAIGQIIDGEQLQVIYIEGESS